MDEDEQDVNVREASVNVSSVDTTAYTAPLLPADVVHSLKVMSEREKVVAGREEKEKTLPSPEERVREEKVTSEVEKVPLEKLMSGVFVVEEVEVEDIVMFDNERVPASVIERRWYPDSMH